MRAIFLLPFIAMASPLGAQTRPSISFETLKTIDGELSSDAHEGPAPTTRAEDEYDPNRDWSGTGRGGEAGQ